MITFDYERARANATDYAANPTPGRAHNAAQHLAPALAEIDRLNAAIAELVERRSKNVNGDGSPGFWLTELGMAATESGVPMPTRRYSVRRSREAS